MPEDRTPYYAEPKKPRLIWQGRDKRKIAEPLPSQTVEIISPFYANAQQQTLDMREEARAENRLIWTNDNLVALTSLLHGDATHDPLEGKIDLIYIDPPFAVQADFKINVEIEDGLSDEKLPTLIEELAYTDTWKDGLDSYLAMMRDRLELLKRLLAPTGSIYVHCDWHAGHYLKVLLDEIFGYENFLNEVIWKRATAGSAKARAKRFGADHDTLLIYTASSDYTFKQTYGEYPAEEIEKRFRQKDKRGRYKDAELGTYSQATLERLKAEDRLIVTSGGKYRYKIYLEEIAGVLEDSIWTDISIVNSQAADRIGYPTQKPVKLLERIIAASSNPGDIVLDCFCGSGTTVVAAETMKDADGKPAPRRWIAIDCGKFAVHITRKRLIEAGARPFAVENIGFYARQGEWKDVLKGSPSAKTYRNAMVEVYGGAPVDGFAYLHGKKGARWVHVGPLNAPVADGQIDCIAREAAGTDIKTVDILSADIPIDWNKADLEAKYGVTLYARIIPQVAIEAVRDRIKRKRQKDPKLEAAPDIHFFTPPDIEVRAEVSPSGSSATVKLTRLTVDLDDCLSTQNAAKRAEIKLRLTDWKALIDYWAVDWDYNGETFRNDWQTFRTRKNRDMATQAAHDYQGAKGDKRIAVKVTDIFGNDGVKVIRVTL